MSFDQDTNRYQKFEIFDIYFSYYEESRYFCAPAS